MQYKFRTMYIIEYISTGYRNNAHEHRSINRIIRSFNYHTKGTKRTLSSALCYRWKAENRKVSYGAGRTLCEYSLSVFALIDVSNQI